MKNEAGTVMLSDGFLRLTLDALLSLRMVHLLSGVDGGEWSSLRRCGTVTVLTGYTEWASAMPHLPVSLGWDWCLERFGREFTYTRVGMPKSNVMLVGSGERDYGWKRNLEALANVVDALPWVEHTRRSVEVC